MNGHQCKPQLYTYPQIAILIVTERRDTLASLKYMDNVVREVLRLLAPAPNTIRKADEDCVIPLGTPVIGRDGQSMSSIPLKKGATIFIRTSVFPSQSTLRAKLTRNSAIQSMNTSSVIWGEDAEEYNPDRYDKMSAEGAKMNQVPGVWGNLLTFLGGQRNCM